MKKVVAFCLVEVSLLGSGAWADRMFSEIPTWALAAGVLVSMTIAAALLLWSMRDEKADTKAVRKAIQRELKERDYRVERLRETVESLPQKPLGDGHTYAELPHGTNVVSMADGTMRLALPVRISDRGSSAVSLQPARLTVTRGCRGDTAETEDT